MCQIADRFPLNFAFFCRNELRKVPSLVQAYTDKKHYLHASKILTQAIDRSNGQLQCIEGLSDLRQDLELRKSKLYAKLIEELNTYLYHSTTGDVLTNFQRQGSARSSAYSSPFQRNVIRRSAERAEANSKIRKALFEMAQGYDLEKTEIIDDTDLLDPDLNSTYFLGIIVECFALLKKVPESIEVCESQIFFILDLFETFFYVHRQLKRKFNLN